MKRIASPCKAQDDGKQIYLQGSYPGANVAGIATRWY